MRIKNIRILSLVVLFSLLVSLVASQDSLLLIESKIKRVVDGDTIWVDGVAESIRLLCIDTEESEKGAGAEERTAAIAKRFPEVVKEQTKSNPYPIGSGVRETRGSATPGRPQSYRRASPPGDDRSPPHPRRLRRG